MILNNANLQEAFRGYKTVFQNAVDSVEDDAIERLAMTVPSTGSGEKFPVGQLLGDLEEVVDEVVFENIAVWVQQVDVRTFAKGVAVKVDALADDSLGIYRPTIENYGRRAAQLPLKLMAHAFVNGFTEEWIDGNPVFYADERNWPGDSEEKFQNRHDLQLTGDNFDTLFQEMEERVGPDGAPLGLTPDVLMCGPSNRAAAEDILEVRRQANGADNRRYGKADLVVNSRITGDQWGLAATTPVKPMALLDRSGPNFYSQTDLTSDAAMHQEQLEFKARRRCNVRVVVPWQFQVSDGNA